jgi:serine phosphatase RsbU (regulator of sigma subunit)/anti-sigma regulatory factor (Ser/Thr protein kinase)
MTTERLQQLQRLTSSLGDALTLDDVARATLSGCLRMPGVIRAGLAVTEGGGRHLQFVSSDDIAGPAALRWCLIDGYADLPLTHLVRTGADIFLPTLDDLEKTFPEILERQRSQGTRSLAAVQLTRNTERLGGLMLCYDHEHEFDQYEQAFLSAFAAQVTQAVRRGLAYQIQYTNSEQLQRSLMPNSLPAVEGLALGSYYQPGGLNVDVGGDWYDVIPLLNGSVVVSLGDVMGKGVEAAIVMSEVRSAARAYAMLDPSPSVVLARLDRLVSSLGGPDQFVTMLYGVIHPQRTSMTLAVAGHPPPLLVPGRGSPEVLDGDFGPALGLEAGPWPENEVDLSSETTVLFYSDGLVESRQVDLARGIDLLREHVARIELRRQNPRELCARLGELVRREDADDDVTVLAAAVTTAREEHSDSIKLPPEPTAAGLARRFVSDRLAAWGVDDDVAEVARLCVSELVTNAVIHSGTNPEVTVRVDDECVLVLVHDRGNRGAVQQAADYDPMGVSGRGLTLIDALATAWSAEHNADGTTVWFELALAEPDAGSPVGAGAARSA